MEKDQRDDEVTLHIRRGVRKTAITLLKREGDSGWQAFPVMTESPDGMTYATGLYIRENPLVELK